MISSVITLRPSRCASLQHGAKIVQRAELRVDVLIIGNVIAVILERRGVKGHQPDRVDTQVADVFQLGGQALEIADAIVVGVEERLDVELIDDRIFVPKRVIGAEAGGRRGLQSRYLDVVHQASCMAHGSAIIGNSRNPARCARAGGVEIHAPARAADRASRSCSGPRHMITLVAQQIMHLVRLFGIELQGADIESTQPDCGLCGSRFTTVRMTFVAGRIRLQVSDQLIVVDGAEMQGAVRLQRGIFPPDAVHARDQRPQAVGLLQAPMPQLIFLRVAVLLAARFARRAFHQLICRPIDAVIRGQRRGKNQPRRKHGAQARLQGLVQDVGRIGPYVGPEVLPARTRGSSSVK